jgi:vacuolar-type H+-ATPase subunit I/STV1
MTTLDHVARSRIVEYIVDAQKEVERLDKELESLEPFIHYNVLAYKKYKEKEDAKDAMRQQFQDCYEALKSL